jgi:nitroreductase
MLRSVKSVARNLRRNAHRATGWIRLFHNYVYDFRRYLRFASPDRTLFRQENQRAMLVMLAHSIEKGLSLQDCRPGFGADKVRSLLAHLDTYLTEHGPDWATATAVQALREYVGFSQSKTQQAHLAEIVATLATVEPRAIGDKTSCKGGTTLISREAILQRSRIHVAEFLTSRHSVRTFDESVVDIALIQRAAELAQTCPSACNRQSGRIHIIPQSPLAERVLACQEGNRGFGHSASHILVITSDIREFLSIGERNQMWVDGGLFAMTLVFALHGLGLGTCFLNWSAPMDRDLKLREMLCIPPWENVITLLAVGHLPPSLRICVSQRRPAAEVVTVHPIC